MTSVFGYSGGQNSFTSCFNSLMLIFGGSLSFSNARHTLITDANPEQPSV